MSQRCFRFTSPRRYFCGQRVRHRVRRHAQPGLVHPSRHQLHPKQLHALPLDGVPHRRARKLIHKMVAVQLHNSILPWLGHRVHGGFKAPGWHINHLATHDGLGFGKLGMAQQLGPACVAIFHQILGGLHPGQLPDLPRLHAPSFGIHLHPTPDLFGRRLTGGRHPHPDGGSRRKSRSKGPQSDRRRDGFNGLFSQGKRQQQADHLPL